VAGRVHSGWVGKIFSKGNSLTGERGSWVLVKNAKLLKLVDSSINKTIKSTNNFITEDHIFSGKSTFFRKSWKNKMHPLRAYSIFLFEPTVEK